MRSYRMIFLLMVFLPLSLLSQSNELLVKITTKLSRSETTISALLSDSTLNSLHSLIAFREIIRQNARAEKITIVNGSEPGDKITVSGIVLDKVGNKMSDKLIYIYQTSSEGWYSDTAPHILQMEGDRKHARLFGYLRSDKDGRFQFSTIKPKGYPNSSLPAHIHIEISLAQGKNLITELLFDDDPRLIPEIRARAIQEKFIITKNTGTKLEPVYPYIIQTD